MDIENLNPLARACIVAEGVTTMLEHCLDMDVNEHQIIIDAWSELEDFYEENPDQLQTFTDSKGKERQRAGGIASLRSKLNSVSKAMICLTSDGATVPVGQAVTFKDGALVKAASRSKEKSERSKFLDLARQFFDECGESELTFKAVQKAMNDGINTGGAKVKPVKTPAKTPAKGTSKPTTATAVAAAKPAKKAA